MDQNQLNTLRSYINILENATAKDETKLKAAQELSEHFEKVHPPILEHALKVFMNILQDGEFYFIQENTIQHVSKLNLQKFKIFQISKNFTIFLQAMCCKKDEL